MPRKPALRLVSPDESGPTVLQREFPKEGKLRPPKQYKGSEALADTTGEYLVSFDAGSFRFIVEQLESLVHRQASELNPVGMPAAKQAAVRALHAVRATAETLGLTLAHPAPAAAPARRGRPPKVAALAEVPAEVPVPAPKRRGRPPKVQAAPEPQAATAPPRRRGRPPKAAVSPAVAEKAPRAVSGAKKASKPADGRTAPNARIRPAQEQVRGGNTRSICKHPARTLKGCSVCDFNARKSGK